MSKGEQTRERLLAIAEAAVLAKGFANTTIDEIHAEAGMTKSGFLYHFRDKTELAKALLERYIAHDDVVLDGAFDRARDLDEDPLQVFLIGLKLLAEQMADLPRAHPGCMVAATAYHDRQFDAQVQEINRAGVTNWKNRFRAMLEDAAAAHPPVIDVDLDDLAMMFVSAMEGGIVLSRVYDTPDHLATQILLYRQFVRAVFLGR